MDCYVSNLRSTNVMLLILGLLEKKIRDCVIDYSEIERAKLKECIQHLKIRDRYDCSNCFCNLLKHNEVDKTVQDEFLCKVDWSEKGVSTWLEKLQNCRQFQKFRVERLLRYM